jgi:tetraacyldisaccharide 4'-kinase
VVSDGRQILLSAEFAGDEPVMLAQNLPGVVVITDKNRIRAGHHAVEKLGCDTLILDDGFQYLRLGRQFNLLLIDKSNPFGHGHLLPRGILREPVGQMTRATHILLTKSDGNPDGELERLVDRHKSPGVPTIECRHLPQFLKTIDGDQWLKLSHLQGVPVALFCGIAAPESFEKFIRSAGAIPVYRRHFPDHYLFTEEDIREIFEQARRASAQLVITTEKDSVRLSSHWVFPLPTYYLRIEIEILGGQDHFEDLLGQITRTTDGKA